MSTASATPSDTGPRLEGVCRVCLFRRDAFCPLAGELNGVNISAMLLRVCGTVFNEQDALPRVICSRCLAKLSVAYAVTHEFRLQEELLRSFYSRGFLQEHIEEVQLNGHVMWYSEEALRKLKATEQSPGVFELKVNDAKEERVNKEGGHPKVHTGEECKTNQPDAEMAIDQKEKSRVESVEGFEILIKQEVNIDTDGSQAADGSDEDEELGEAAATVSDEMYQWVDTATEKDITSSFPTDGSTANCPLCKKSFTKKRSYVIHIIRHKHKRAGKFQCDFCSRIFGTKAYLFKHRQLHRNEPGYAEDLPKVDERRKFNMPKTPSVLECQECGKVFEKKATYRNHLIKHEHLKLGTYQCHICSKVTGTRYDLNSHMKVHENPVIPRVPKDPKPNATQCPECGKEFIRESTYLLHLRRHENVRLGTYRCGICDTVFSNMAELAGHEQTHLAGEGEEMDDEEEEPMQHQQDGPADDPEPSSSNSSSAGELLRPMSDAANQPAFLEEQMLRQESEKLAFEREIFPRRPAMEGTP